MLRHVCEMDFEEKIYLFLKHFCSFNDERLRRMLREHWIRHTWSGGKLQMDEKHALAFLLRESEEALERWWLADGHRDLHADACWGIRSHQYQGDWNTPGGGR